MSSTAAVSAGGVGPAAVASPNWGVPAWRRPSTLREMPTVCSR